jgi:hypothetical protein
MTSLTPHHSSIYGNTIMKDQLSILQKDASLDWITVWERAGTAAVEQDLIMHDGKHLCGGVGHVRREAWRWLRMCRAAALKQAYDRGRTR